MWNRRNVTLLVISLVAVAFCAGVWLGVHVVTREENMGPQVFPGGGRSEAADMKEDAVSPRPSSSDHPLPAGQWSRARVAPRSEGQTPEEREQEERLLAIGYASGVNPAPHTDGVTVHHKERTYSGINLVVSGHKAVAMLMDMEGNELHSWERDFEDVWPDREVQRGKLRYFRGTPLAPEHEYWVRVHLFENGDILAIFQFHGLIKLDKDSNLLWAKEGQFHHDLAVAEDGTIYVLTRDESVYSRHIKDSKIFEDFVCLLDSEGNELRRVSLLDSLENSDYRQLIRQRLRLLPSAPGPFPVDLFHTNSIQLLDGKAAPTSLKLRAGNVLTSIHQLNTVAVVDMDLEKVVWAMTGMWMFQHYPRFLDTGSLLVFDNFADEESSKVVEVDPSSQEVLWVYAGSEDTPFFTGNCGSCQRLPNGNTLIVESTEGRVFETAPDKTIVWEYVNPHRAGEDSEFIAVLFDAVRFDERAVAWLDTL